MNPLLFTNSVEFPFVQLDLRLRFSWVSLNFDVILTFSSDLGYPTCCIIWETRGCDWCFPIYLSRFEARTKKVSNFSVILKISDGPRCPSCYSIWETPTSDWHFAIYLKWFGARTKKVCRKQFRYPTWGTALVNCVHIYILYEDSYWETFLRGGINHRVTLFLWRSEFTQKHAQSTGNHTERLWEKKSRPKSHSRKKVRAFFWKKVPSGLISYVKWHVILHRNP